MLLHHPLERMAESAPERLALVAGEGRLSYAALRDASAALAATLARAGISRGDRIAVQCGNRAESVVAIYAASMLGAIFVPLHPAVGPDKLAHIARDAAPGALICAPDTLRRWDAAGAAVPRCVVTTGAGAAHEAGSLGFEAAIADPVPGDGERWPAIDCDAAAIIYTSGSTGGAKGVTLSHLNVLSATRSIAEYLAMAPRDRILCVLPLSFDYGLYQVFLAVGSGAAIVIDAPFTYPGRVVDLLAREAITVFPLVPTLAGLLERTVDPQRSFAGVRAVTNTGAAMHPERLPALRRLFPNALVYLMYGLTECKRVSYLPPAELATRPRSIGRGMPNEEVFLVDEDGRRLPDPGVGELCVRGSNIMLGYWKDPEATARMVSPGPDPGQRILRTGDLFRSDAEGYLYFLGRKDDVIKSRGEKVSPGEVEAALVTSPEVAEAAVVGMADELLGEAVVAFVIPRPGATLGEPMLRRHCMRTLEPHAIPSRFVVCPALPRLESGKVDRTALRASLEAPGPADAAAAPEERAG